VGWFTIRGGFIVNNKYAIGIDKVHCFKKPIDPFDLIDKFRPPQSWQYFKADLEKLYAWQQAVQKENYPLRPRYAKP
jgi:hypothetical protein